MRLTKMPAEYLWLHMHKRIAAFICRYTMYGHFWPAILDTPHYRRDMTRPLVDFVLRPPSSAPDRHHCAARLFSTAIGPTAPLQCPCRPKTDASKRLARSAAEFCGVALLEKLIGNHHCDNYANENDNNNVLMMITKINDCDTQW